MARTRPKEVPRRAMAACTGALTLLLLVLGSPALAQTATTTLQIDRTILAVGGVATVEVTVSGAQGALGNPEIPASEGFTLAFAGQSSAFRMERGSVSQSVTFSYQLRARAVGTWPLGPASVTLGSGAPGSRASSDAVSLKIVEGSAAASAGAGPSSPQFVLARVDNPRPYVGQSLAWTLEVGSSTQIRQPTLAALPDFGGLSSEPGIAPEWETRVEAQDGRRIELFTAVLPLFAVEPGATRIGAATVVLPEIVRGGGMFAQIREIQLQTPPVAVDVRALPVAGRPGNFEGAVGRFSLRATVDASTVQTGETITLSVVLEGVGALRAPSLKIAAPEGLKIYDEDPDVQVGLAGGQIHSRATFRKALVPLRPGRIELPAISFSYFDPDSGRYATADSGPIRLIVEGEAVAEPAVARSEGIASSKEQVEILGTDILPLRSGDRILGDRRRGLGSPLILCLLVLPPLGLGGLIAVTARRRRAGSDAGRAAARQRAASQATRACKEAHAAGDHEAAERALRDYLAARLARVGGTVGPTDAEALLRDAGAPEALGGTLRSLLARAEGVHYGGERPEGLAEAISDWVEAAHRSWR